MDTSTPTHGVDYIVGVSLHTYLGTSDLPLDNDRYYDGHSTQDTAKIELIAQTWQRF